MADKEQTNKAPFPLSIIRGRLRLAGLDFHEIETIVDGLTDRGKIKEDNLEIQSINESVLESLDSAGFDETRKNYQTVLRFEGLKQKGKVRPIVIMIEGASATGKTIVALQVIRNLQATRFISTDTVRQSLRSILKQDECPELFTHTYQAHKFKQSGKPDQSKIVRGYLAQCDLIIPTIRRLTGRLLDEGTDAVIEGVHIFPGMSEGVLEVVINPTVELHQAMFLNKHRTGLTTVSSDTETRLQEFNWTREIQEYIVETAKKEDVPVVKFTTFEQTEQEINRIIIDKIIKSITTS